MRIPDHRFGHASRNVQRDGIGQAITIGVGGVEGAVTQGEGKGRRGDGMTTGFQGDRDGGLSTVGNGGDAEGTAPAACRPVPQA